MATRETIAAQITTLHTEVRQLHALMARIAERLAIDVPPTARHEASTDGRVFIPGTGWTGTTPAHVDDELPTNDRGAPVVDLDSARTRTTS